MQITTLMIEEHEKIEISLEKFLEKSDPAFFKIFEEKLKKHFGVEKGVIFLLTEKFLGEELEDILKLKEQHIKILKEVKDIKEKGLNIANDLIKNLIKDLSDHTKYEEIIFYPKIDNLLDENQKEIIIQEVRKII
jgi:hemerythrin-like domain-containing protein